MPKYCHMNLSATIRRARKKARLSLAAVAEECGVSVPTVWGWERGKQRPRIDRLPAIAAALSISVGDLVKGMR